ncbi:hypothetical protein M9H77_22518 [Catharanthus roseus]|uniref:Uncharacterized protein n=1 Tax=Catharanthus roseus TaxID=4058 RepID=A0ACC0AS66_CATRO|nr:hypothetical protein M9H77_22518 [Catharanthus roseus]
MPMLAMVKQVEVVEVVKRGKGKQVARSKTPLDKFISVQVAANSKAWTQKKRKIAPGHRLFPNVGHKSSITNMHSFVMLAMHEHRKMNFGFLAIEHMLATQSSSTKCLPYGCFITKIFQYFEINLVGVADHIGLGKIYNQNTFKRMGFERIYVGLFIRGEQKESDDDDDEEDNGDEEEENEPKSIDDEEENIRKEMRSKKRQERTEEGQSSLDTAQILDRIDAMQAQIQNRVTRLEQR